MDLSNFCGGADFDIGYRFKSLVLVSFFFCGLKQKQQDQKQRANKAKISANKWQQKTQEQFSKRQH